MAYAQTAYGARQPAYVAGMVVNQELHNSVSRINADEASIGVGKAVFFTPSGGQAITATPAANRFEGVTIRDTLADQGDTFAKGATIPVAKVGVIAVSASVAVTKGEPAYVTPAGAFTNVVAGNVALVGATFDDTITAAGLVPLRLK